MDHAADVGVASRAPQSFGASVTKPIQMPARGRGFRRIESDHDAADGMTRFSLTAMSGPARNARRSPVPPPPRSPRNVLTSPRSLRPASLLARSIMVRIPRSFVLLSVVALAAAVPAQTRLLRFDGLPNGPTVNKVPCAGLGDLDGDGLADLAIGRAALNNYDGAVFLHSSRNSALIARIDGGAGLGSSFGIAIGPIGDIDRDGVEDFAIGAAAHRVGAAQTGAAHVYSGRTRAHLATLLGDGDGDLFGSVVAPCGDTNADGHPDFAVGAPENGNAAMSYGAGYAKVFSGRDFTVLLRVSGARVADEFGSAIAPVGDVDHDGRSDFMVGALLEASPTGGQGSARVYSGATGSVIHEFLAEAASDHFGVAVGSPGDVDADGIDDFMVGAISMVNPTPAKVWLFSGLDGSTIGSVVGEAGSMVFGLRLAAAGDVDQDGHDDFWVADPMNSAIAPMLGAIFLVSGRTLGTLMTLRGPNSMAGFAMTMTTIRDLDRDGLPELGIGVAMAGLPQGGTTTRFEVISPARRVAQFGLGCSTTQVPTLDATAPTIGRPMAMFVTSRAVPSPGVLLLGAVPDRPFPLQYGCSVYLDVANVSSIATFVTDGAGRWTGAFPIPASPGLIGVPFALQSFVVATAGPQLFDATNGVYATIGQ